MKKIEKIYPIIFFIFVSIIATFPLVLNMSGKIFGLPTDSLAVTWNFWWLNYAKTLGLPQMIIPIISAPFGVDVSAAPYYPIWNIITTNLTGLLGEIVTYNVQILLGFILSGLLMYYLVLIFTKNKMASLIIGMLFTLSPYHFSQAFQYVGLSNMQWIVLFILALFHFKNRPSYINAILCGISFAIVGVFDYYYLYFSGIFAGVFWGYCFFYYREDLKNRIRVCLKPALVGMFTAGVCLLPCIYHIIKNILTVSKSAVQGVEGLSRPFGHLFADSARILNYLLPAHYHPILGKITRPFIGSFLFGDTPEEQTLYLGYMGIILAIIGFKYFKKKQVQLGQSYRNTEESFVISFFIVSFFTFIVFSFPPYLSLGKFFIPFPSFFLYKIFPMFRNYARFGILVLISMCVISGFGLKYVLEQISLKRKRIFLGCVLGLCIFLEFLPYPPFKTFDISVNPPVYEWLRDQPGDFLIAEYPIEADGRPYIFYQRVHQKRMVNFSVAGTYAFEVRQKILDLENVATAGILKFLGTKYILVNKNRYLNYEGGRILGVVPDLSNKLGFRFIENFGKVDVYEVLSEPIDPATITIDKGSIVLSKAQKIDSQRPLNMSFNFKAGDKFGFILKYMGLIPAVDFNIDLIKGNPTNDNDTILIKANASTVGFLSVFFDGKAQLKSVFDTNDFFNYKYEELINVGGKIKKKKAVFDRDNCVMSTKDRQVRIDKYTQDPISAIFFISSQEMLIGKKITVFLNPGKTNYRLELVVDSQDQIKNKEQVYQCWKLNGKLIRINGKNKKIADITLWFDRIGKQQLIKLDAFTKAGLITLEKQDKLDSRRKQ